MVLKPYLQLIALNILGAINPIKHHKNLPGSVSDNAERPISIRTYIGDDQVTHPKVLFFENGFGGYKYWMAYTTFPWGIDRFENPCIAYSTDGYKWHDIENNPIDDAKGDGYFSDTHLVYREDTNKLECWYRYVSNVKKKPVHEVLYRQISSDGINWCEKETIYDNDSGDYAMLMSPCIIYDGDKYNVFTVSNVGGHHIDYYSYDGREFVKENSISFPKGEFYIWHIDVASIADGQAILMMCKSRADSPSKKWKLFIAKGSAENGYKEPVTVLEGRDGAWDEQLYRSSFVKVGNDWRVYYSGISNNRRRGVGVITSSVLNDYLGS